MNPCVSVALLLNKVLLVATAVGDTFAVPLVLALSTPLVQWILWDKPVVQMKSSQRVDSIAGKNAETLQRAQPKRTV